MHINGSSVAIDVLGSNQGYTCVLIRQANVQALLFDHLFP